MPTLLLAASLPYLVAGKLVMAGFPAVAVVHTVVGVPVVADFLPVAGTPVVAVFSAVSGVLSLLAFLLLLNAGVPSCRR